MKPQYLFIACLLIGCQKPKPVDQAIAATPGTKTETIAAKENFLKIDTISIADYGETSKDNYVLAYLLDQKADKDSIVTGKYRLDFYQNKTKTSSSNISIKGVDKGSEWNAIYGLGTESAKSSPFIQISFGYPACGYNQSHYLYYLKNNDIQLVYDWYTIGIRCLIVVGEAGSNSKILRRKPILNHSTAKQFLLNPMIMMRTWE